MRYLHFLRPWQCQCSFPGIIRGQARDSRFCCPSLPGEEVFPKSKPFLSQEVITSTFGGCESSSSSSSCQTPAPSPGLPSLGLHASGTSVHLCCCCYFFLAHAGALQLLWVSPTAHSSDTLQDAVVPLLSSRLCNSSCMYSGALTHRMLCAGYLHGRADACQVRPVLRGRGHETVHLEGGTLREPRACDKGLCRGVF